VAAAVIEHEEPGARPYADDILKLVVTLPVEGQTQNVQFDFHLVEDDPVQVAKEMVQELGIPPGAVLEISETISGLACAARMKQEKHSMKLKKNGQYVQYSQSQPPKEHSQQGQTRATIPNNPSEPSAGAYQGSGISPIPDYTSVNGVYQHQNAPIPQQLGFPEPMTNYQNQHLINQGNVGAPVQQQPQQHYQSMPPASQVYESPQVHQMTSQSYHQDQLGQASSQMMPSQQQQSTVMPPPQRQPSNVGAIQYDHTVQISNQQMQQPYHAFVQSHGQTIGQVLSSNDGSMYNQSEQGVQNRQSNSTGNSNQGHIYPHMTAQTYLPNDQYISDHQQGLQISQSMAPVPSGAQSGYPPLHPSQTIHQSGGAAMTQQHQMHQMNMQPQQLPPRGSFVQPSQSQSVDLPVYQVSNSGPATFQQNQLRSPDQYTHSQSNVDNSYQGNVDNSIQSNNGGMDSVQQNQYLTSSQQSRRPSNAEANMYQTGNSLPNALQQPQYFPSDQQVRRFSNTSVDAQFPQDQNVSLQEPLQMNTLQNVLNVVNQQQSQVNSQNSQSMSGGNLTTQGIQNSTMGLPIQQNATSSQMINQPDLYSSQPVSNVSNTATGIASQSQLFSATTIPPPPQQTQMIDGTIPATAATPMHEKTASSVHSSPLVTSRGHASAQTSPIGERPLPLDYGTSITSSSNIETRDPRRSKSEVPVMTPGPIIHRAATAGPPASSSPMFDRISSNFSASGDDDDDVGFDEDDDDDEEDDDDNEFQEEMRKLEEDYMKTLQRAKKVFDSRMDNLQRSQLEREAQHQKTLEKHEKERADFEKRLAIEAEQQNKRIKQLQSEWNKRRETLAKHKRRVHANSAGDLPNDSATPDISPILTSQSMPAEHKRSGSNSFSAQIYGLTDQQDTSTQNEGS
jgi:hypothetical protein